MNKKIMICSMAAGAALLLSACSTNNESTKETTDTFVTEGSITETFATESTTDIKGDFSSIFLREATDALCTRSTRVSMPFISSRAQCTIL